MIVNAALTGCVHKRDDSLYVPMTPEEIAKDVYRCARDGANIFHIHARDREFNPTWKKGIYAEIIQRIREIEPSAIVCVSTSGRHWSCMYKRSDALHLDPPPEMASLTMGSYNSFDNVIVNPPLDIQWLACRMRDKGIRPELECFEIGHIHYAKYLIGKGIIEPPFYFNLFVGNLGTVDVPGLGAMVMELPKGALWSAAGIGRYQWEVSQAALRMMGGVRVGLEDSLWLDGYTKEIPAQNQDLVRRVVAYGHTMGLRPYSPEEVRERLCLRSSC